MHTSGQSDWLVKSLDMTRDEALKATVELQKIFSDHHKNVIDFAKHITTISIGIIVLSATFIDKINDSEHVIWAIPLAIVCLLLTVLYSVKVLVGTLFVSSGINTATSTLTFGTDNEAIVNKVQELKAEMGKIERGGNVAMANINILFALAVILLGVFVVANVGFKKSPPYISPPRSAPASPGAKPSSH